jgi:two-component system, OmpR family, sensor kinase
VVPSSLHSGEDRPAAASHRRGESGSALGLSIAKAIVERHHGSIDMTSVPGRTAFTIVLPHPSAEPAHHSTSTNL